MDISKVFSGNNINLNTVARLAAIGLCGFVIYKIYKSAKQNSAIYTESTAGSTLSDTNISALAQKISSSWGFLNDDEDAIYNAFRALGNRQDLIKLMRAYSYKNENLVTSINRRMSNKEIAKINNILKSKGINFSF